GETTGIFQLESAGMRRYIRELRPTSVYDLAAMVALYRPGPMENIPAYIRRKHGKEKVTYLHPLLEPYLEKTYGIFVYQEDIMSAAVALGGFTGPEADTLGYAIRKKKSSVLRAQKERFVTQAAERGVAPVVIDQVFAAFQPFERYGFNKAHATCYGLIAYQTAYLKANFTVDYMTAVLSAFRDNEEKVAAAVAECRRLGIEVRPPDVMRSAMEFTVEDEAIRFGLLAVKNVGQGAIESIVAAREAEGPFKSLRDFCERVDLRLVNSRVIEALGWVGALSKFGHPAQILDALPSILPSAQAVQQQNATGQISAFEMLFAEAPDEELPTVAEAPRRERLRKEKELLGVYLSEHPMGEIADRVSDFVTAYSGDLKDESLDGQRLVVAGIVIGSRTVITRARSTMAVVTLEDLQGSLEVVVFPKLYEQTGPTWQEGAILLVAGRVDHRGEEVSLLADLVMTWEEAVSKGPEGFARDVAAGDRGAWRRRQPAGVVGGTAQIVGGTAPVAYPGPNGNDNGNRSGTPSGVPGGSGQPSSLAQSAAPEPVAVGPGMIPAAAARAPRELGRRPDIPYVSPLRGGVPPPEGPLEIAASAAPAAPVTPSLPSIDPAEPVPTYPEEAGGSAGPERDLEAALPDEARARSASAAEAPTAPLEASSNGSVLHVRFGGAPAARLILAMETFRELARERPGDTPVVVHVPAPGGSALPVELRARVAYDADLLAEVHRRLEVGIVQLSVVPPSHP
ncbi:MAG: OB-fold nucleic acid binding domain-containing protein, partial [Chloroflexota bacterium]